MKGLLHDIAECVQILLSEHMGTESIGDEVGIGADGTPTCKIDLIAETEVLEIIEERDAALNVLSEEAGFVDRGFDETLVLDPIDGTYNATTGIPIYCISMAVGRARLSDIRCGLVKDLVHGDTYWAEKENGAFLNGVQISVGEFEDKKTVFSVPLSRLAPESSYIAAHLPKRVRILGSAALEMCMLARGVMDVYYNQSRHRGSLRIVDIAAASLILREAGGEVFDDKFEILDMEFDVKLRKNVLAVRNLKYMDMIRDAVRRQMQ